MKTATKHSLAMAMAVVVTAVGLALAPAHYGGATPPDDASPAVAAANSGRVPADAASAAEGSTNDLPATIAEARGRARMLHEMLHGALQVMHRDFFQEDESLTLPSQSLEDVFDAVSDQWNVEIRWLAVNAAAMNADHQPQDAFEKQAAKALASGALEFERIEANQYRHVGTIRLASQCLKCHLPRRTSTEDRAAGLAITLPLQRKTK